MLGKLLKHEFRATRRIMLPVLALFLGITALMTLVGPMWQHLGHTNIGNGGAPEYLMLIATVVILVTYCIFITAAACVTVFNSIGRFHKNVLGDEGYLTHTLPVTAGQNLLARLIVSVVWTMVSLILVVFSASVLVYAQISGWGIGDVWSVSIGRTLGGVHVDVAALILFWLNFVAGICLSYLWIYCSMSIGYSFDRGKIAISFLTAFCFSIAGSILTSMLMFGLDMGFVDSYGDLLRFALTVVECVVLFLVTRYFLEKRLNLN